MLICGIGGIKVIRMIAVPESKHRNNGPTRSWWESHTRSSNRHRSRKRRSIRLRLRKCIRLRLRRISDRRASIRRLIADRWTSIRRLIADRWTSIRRLIADRCHNGRNDRSNDRLRDVHFNLVMVVTVVVVIVVVVTVVTVVAMMLFAYFDVNMSAAKADTYRLLTMMVMSMMVVVV